MALSADSDMAQAASQYNNAQGQHTAHLSHELLAAAASFEAAKAYENHVDSNGKLVSCFTPIPIITTTSIHTSYSLPTGKPDSYGKAKEILASFAGAFVDREIETKGLDYIDRENAKRQATVQAQEALANSGQF
jgi:hypothetical protein